MKTTLVLQTPHIKNDEVRVAQQLLKQHGYLLDERDVDGEFGPTSAQASYWAQYWCGYATPKQSFGPALEKLLSGEVQPNDGAKKRIAERKAEQKRNPLGQRALKEMEKFVGLKEEGANCVPAITGWWGKGNIFWCAATVSKAYILAGSKAFTRGDRYAYVPYIVHDARGSANHLTVTNDPKPGDLVCYDWDGSNFASDNNHVGMFVSGTSANFTTIEGNFENRCDRWDRTSGTAKRIVFVRVTG